MHKPNYNDLIHYPLIMTAFEKVKSNKGIAGVDKVTIGDFEENLNQALPLLLKTIEDEQFSPSPYHTVELQQRGKKPRRLAIPTVGDRVIHTAVAMLLQPYFEPHFERCSFGYRPNRSYKMAVAEIIKYREQGFHWVFDADIKQFFDNIPHADLLTVLATYLDCERLIALIRQCLFEHQCYQGKVSFGNAKGVGLPQGSSLSPLLANLYLDTLDEQLLAKGYKLIRYADDFVVLTKDSGEAEQAWQETDRILSILGLALNTDKTKVTSFEQGFMFLGHSFINDMVLDEKSQLPFSLRSNTRGYQPDDDPLTTLGVAITPPQNHQTMIPEEIQNRLTSAIFDQQEWQQAGDVSANPTLGVVLSTRLRTLYVTTQGAVLNKRGNRLIVSFQAKVLSSVPLSTLDAVILFGRCHLTTDVMVYCLHHDMPVIFSSQSGGFYGILDNYSSYNETLLRQQVSHTQSLPKQLCVAKALLDAKFNNSLVILKRAIRKRTDEKTLQSDLTALTANIKRFRNKLKRENSQASILGLEGIVAKQYFALYRYLFDRDWGFNNRNRQPPKDPVNVMLSLGYTILFKNIYTLVKLKKLNPTLGYLHHGGDNQPSIVLDLMEQFRATIVDATVYKLTNSQQITPADFTQTEGGCQMNKHAYTLFVTAIEEKLQSQISHPTTLMVCDYRRIIDIQIELLKSAILDDSTSYEAFRIR